MSRLACSANRSYTRLMSREEPMTRPISAMAAFSRSDSASSRVRSATRSSSSAYDSFRARAITLNCWESSWTSSPVFAGMV